MKTDSLFYLLFQSAPGILLELLGKPYSSDYEYQAVEVKEVAFRFDGVMRPAIESAEQPTIFVEVQFQLDEYFYHRFFAEIFLFLRKNPDVEHWQAIVLFEKRSRETTRQQPFRSLLDSSQVQILYLSDLQEEAFDSLELSVLQLIVVDQNLAVEKAKQIISRAEASNSLYLSRAQILELVETIIVYKFPLLTREVVTNMLMIDELKQTRVYKDALEGGKQEGREEGKQEGQRVLMMKLLGQRLGNLPEAVASQIGSLQSEQLEMLGDRLLTFSTLQELISYLSDIAAR